MITSETVLEVGEMADKVRAHQLMAYVVYFAAYHQVRYLPTYLPVSCRHHKPNISYYDHHHELSRANQPTYLPTYLPTGGHLALLPPPASSSSSSSGLVERQGQPGAEGGGRSSSHPLVFLLHALLGWLL